MIPPIIIVDGYDLDIYESVEDVEVYYEPNFIYSNRSTGEKVKVYDSLGYVLDISEEIKEVESRIFFFVWRRRFRTVKLTKVNPEEKRTEELRSALIKFLEVFRGKEKEHLQNFSLEELISKAAPW